MAQSVMNPGGLITSCGDVPDVRATRESPDFYISLEDDLMRLFGSERLMNVFNALGVEEGEQIEHKMLSSAIEKAQQKIESNNFGIRKNLLEYDQVMNEQREIIYEERRKVLDGENMRDSIFHMMNDYIENVVDKVNRSGSGL